MVNTIFVACAVIGQQNISTFCSPADTCMFNDLDIKLLTAVVLLT